MRHVAPSSGTAVNAAEPIQLILSLADFSIIDIRSVDDLRLAT
jgi:hypothetical protein